MITGYDLDGVLFNGLDVSKEDKCLCVTGRSFHRKKETEEKIIDLGLKNYTLYMCPTEKESLLSACKWKAYIINEAGITTFYEDDYRVANYLRAHCPSCNVIIWRGVVNNVVREEHTLVDFRFITKFNGTRHIADKALKWCKGKGVDCGYGDAVSWPGGVEYILPGAHGIDEGVIKRRQEDGTLKEERDEDIEFIFSFPPDMKDLDFIFSSHALEHIDIWQTALRHWKNHLKDNGIIFLYLPHVNVPQWLPENYREHKWSPTLEIVNNFMLDMGMVLEEALEGHDKVGSFYGVWRKA
jgi:hypothetical protein